MLNKRKQPSPNIAVSPELIAKVDSWVLAQAVTTTRTAVIETAIREFLERNQRRERRAIPQQTVKAPPHRRKAISDS